MIANFGATILKHYTNKSQLDWDDTREWLSVNRSLGEPLEPGWGQAKTRRGKDNGKASMRVDGPQIFTPFPPPVYR